jgi:hypothetical protein
MRPPISFTYTGRSFLQESWLASTLVWAHCVYALHVFTCTVVGIFTALVAIWTKHRKNVTYREKRIRLLNYTKATMHVKLENMHGFNIYTSIMASIMVTMLNWEIWTTSTLWKQVTWQYIELSWPSKESQWFRPFLQSTIAQYPAHSYDHAKPPSYFK